MPCYSCCAFNKKTMLFNVFSYSRIESPVAIRVQNDCPITAS